VKQQNVTANFAMNEHMLLLLVVTPYHYLAFTDTGLLATRSNVSSRTIITPLRVQEVATAWNRQLTRSVTEAYGYGAMVALTTGQM
jgi:hypothetical protein